MNVIIVAATVLALGLRLYRVMRPGLLNVTQYDDGPYFGSAVHLVYGIAPYRDFVLVQPPGITLLMSPVALAGRVFGTAWGMATARILTAIASAAGIPLAGLLVRHRGWLAVVLACGLFAIYPDSVAAAHTVLLEPWLVLFCLAGAVAVFDGDRLAGSTRLAWGGAAFGFAGAVKTWAIAPVLVVFLLCLPRLRRTAVFTGGVTAGFLVPILPFAILAPRRLFDSVVVAQLARVNTRVPVWHRLQDMVGVVHPKALGALTVGLAALVVVAIVAAALLAGWRARLGPLPTLDRFALLTTILVVAMFLWPPYFASHYTAFLAPFLALAIALPLARLAARRTLGAGGPAGAGAPPARKGLTWVVAGLGAVVMLAALPQDQVGAPLPSRASPGATIARVIPPGACVLSDQVSYLLVADRFVSDVPGCPQIVDGLGTDLVLSQGLRPGSGAGRVPAVAATWRAAFTHAQYMLLSANNGLRIAWTPALRLYFTDHFSFVMNGNGYGIYARKSLHVHRPVRHNRRHRARHGTRHRHRHHRAHRRHNA